MIGLVILAVVSGLVLTRNDAFDIVGTAPGDVRTVPGARVSAEVAILRVVEDAVIESIEPARVDAGAQADIRVYVRRSGAAVGLFLNGGCSLDGPPPRSELSVAPAGLAVRRGDEVRVAVIASASRTGATEVSGVVLRYRQGRLPTQTQRHESGSVRLTTVALDDLASTTCA